MQCVLQAKDCIKAKPKKIVISGDLFVLQMQKLAKTQGYHLRIVVTIIKTFLVGIPI